MNIKQSTCTLVQTDPFYSVSGLENLLVKKKDLLSNNIKSEAQSGGRLWIKRKKMDKNKENGLKERNG